MILDIKVDVHYFVCHASHYRALVQAMNLRYSKQLLASDVIVHECCDKVAVSLHVCKIEHAIIDFQTAATVSKSLGVPTTRPPPTPHPAFNCSALGSAPRQKLSASQMVPIRFP